MSANCTAPCILDSQCPSCDCSETSGGTSIGAILALPVLLILSGLFSGLNLGLLSLDNIGLEIVLSAGTEAEKTYAGGLVPLRKNGNLLLCTLLLGNTAVNAVLAVLMADLTGGIVGTTAVTFGIVIFGEIIPQSICSRHGLAIGYYTRYVVVFFMVALYLIAAPISWVLDYVLEEEIGNVYNREQMMKLFEVHARKNYGDLINDEITILKGVLQLGKTTVEKIMTPIDQVFMLDVNARMDYKTMAKILAKGHSRIPVYDGDINNVYKLLLVKNMIMLNPGDEVPLRNLLQEGFPEPLYVRPGITLDQMLNEFQDGGSHLAIVSEDAMEYKSSDLKKEGKDGTRSIVPVKSRRNLGIVTLEDVIETMIQEPIKDETEGPDTQNIGQKFLKVLNRKNKFKSSTLSTTEGRAISSFLQGMFDPFRPDVIGTLAVEKLVQSSETVDLQPDDRTRSNNVYTAGEPANFCCLILDGSLRIKVGLQQFTSDAGVWKMLALHSLTEKNYVPDFTATVVKECTILKIARADYEAVIEGKTLQPRGPPQKGLQQERKSVVKKIYTPTVKSLRREYGNEIEFEEELKKGSSKPLLRSPPEEGDLQTRSMSAGIIMNREKRGSRGARSSRAPSHGGSISGNRGSDRSLRDSNAIQMTAMGAVAEEAEGEMEAEDDEKQSRRGGRSFLTRSGRAGSEGLLGRNRASSDEVSSRQSTLK
mmetsp:Transcript_14858/g.24190  ORF Transcript_14858/g.24190 Transcript_14858/m.24190 type:complete len:706 (+) Transcript_14858:190-2307(+)